MRPTMNRQNVIELLAQVRRTLVSPNEIADFLEDWGQGPQDSERALLAALSDYYQGAPNGFLSELYLALTGRHVEVIGSEAHLHACPCCHYRTLTERHDAAAGTGYDVCRQCGWEDDGTEEPDITSGPNSGTMEQYRNRMADQSNTYLRDRWFLAKR